MTDILDHYPNFDCTKRYTFFEEVFVKDFQSYDIAKYAVIERAYHKARKEIPVEYRHRLVHEISHTFAGAFVCCLCIFNPM